MSGWLLRNRVLICLLANTAAWIAFPAGAAQHGESPGRALYAALLFSLCSAPLLLLASFNSRHVLLVLFMMTYFLHFGGVDAQALLIGEEVAPLRDRFVTPAEVAVLAGALVMLAGYFAAARFAAPRAGGTRRDWPPWALLLVGLALWTAGTAAVIYMEVFVVTEKTNAAAARGFSQMGPLLTFLVMLGHLAQPLGLLVLTYGYARFRGLWWTALIIAVAVGQVFVGFITDVKATALLAGVVVIVTRTFVDNRLPRTWLVAALVFVIAGFPVLEAYRAEVTGDRGLNKLQAFREFGKVLAIAIADRNKVRQAPDPGARAPTFLERLYTKDNLENVIAHVPADVPYLHGASLVALPMAFVPRLIAPDKDTEDAGQMYTRLIMHSDLDTYIALSHLGELYWNFGWPGIAGGMLIAGLILGAVAMKSSLEGGATLTRVMVLVATVQYLCVGFEGTVPNSYVTWMRAMAAIGLLHLLFARRASVPAAAAAAPETIRVESAGSRIDGSTVSAPQAIRVHPAVMPRFPNLMR